MRTQELIVRRRTSCERRLAGLLRMLSLSAVALSALALAAALPLSALAAEPPTGIIDLVGIWRFRTDPDDVGFTEEWQRPDHDDSQWRPLYVPGAWEEQGITADNTRYDTSRPYNGYAWYRRHFTVPAAWKQAKVVFRSGEIHDMDWSFVNGVLIGSTTEDEPWTRTRQYVIASDVLKPGEDNVIAVRVCDLGGIGGLVGGPVEVVTEVVASIRELERPAEVTVMPPRGYSTTRQQMVKVGGSIHVEPATLVEEDVVAVAGSVMVNGHVRGNVVAVGGSVRAQPGSRIDGDAVAVGGSVIRTGDAMIGGSVVEVPFFPTDVVNRLVRGVGAEPTDSGLRWWPLGGLPFFAWPATLLANMILYAVLALLALLLFPQRLEVMARALPAYPGRAALYGLGGSVLTPGAIAALALAAVFVSIILTITLVGILLIPAVALGVAAAVLAIALVALLGVIGVWLSLGRAISAELGRPDMRTLWAALIGMAIVAVAAAIPVIGPLVRLTVIILGFGVAIMTGLGADPEWAHRRLSRGPKGPSPSPPSGVQPQQVGQPAVQDSGESATTEEAAPEEKRPDEERPSQAPPADTQ
jgi:hypothetical protein